MRFCLVIFNDRKTEEKLKNDIYQLEKIVFRDESICKRTR